MSTEAMKLALETAEGIVNANWREWHELASPEEFERWVKSRANHMAVALREALAEQPAQQEPVAWEQFYPEMGKPKLAYLPPTESSENACYIPPAQRTWVGLTDEEIKLMDVGITSNASFYAGALWAEAKLKEKNT